jgi:hypothetical protein
MADVAQMDLVEPDQISFDKYEDGGPKNFGPPPEGRYFARVPLIPAGDDPEVFQKTQQNYLKIKIDPLEIIDGGYKVRFTTLSAKKYSNREGNQILDFIHACGLDLRPQTNEDYKNAVRQCSGRTCQFGLVWEAYNKNDQTSTKGAKNFPVGEDGKPQSWLPDPYEDGKKIYANGRVAYWVSGLQKT